MTATAAKESLTEFDWMILKRAARLEWAEACAKDKDILGWGMALMPDKFKLEFCHEFHGYIVSIRNEVLTGTEGPRNYAKTLIGCVLLPMFQSVYEPEAFQHYLNVQNTGTKADAVNVAIRHEFEANDLLRDLVGNMVGTQKWTDSQFVLKNGVCFTAIGSGSSVRGLQWLNQRPDFVVVDDLYTRDHINNLEATQKMNDWFWGDLYPARDKVRPARVHLQGTAINNYDVLEKMKKMPGVVFKSFQAIKDWDRKVVLWPQMDSFESLMVQRTNMGSVIFARELQNERRDEATAIIKRSWLYPEDGSPSWEYNPQDLKFDRDMILVSVLLLCDPSIGEKVQNDFTAAGIIYRVRYRDAVPGDGDNFYIHLVRAEQLSLDKRIKLLQDIASNQPKDRPVTQCRIESIAGFKDFTEEVRRRTNLPVKEIDHVKDKISNRENKSHYFENHKVHLNSQIDPAMKDQIVFQLTTNYPQHDDISDMILLAMDVSSGVWNFVK